MSKPAAHEVDAATGESIAQLHAHLDRLLELSELPPNWDGQGEEPPTIAAFTCACTAVAWLVARGVSPLTIVPSSDGGIGINAIRGSRRSTVHCEDDGTVAVSYANADGTWTSEVIEAARAFGDAAARIKQHLEAE